MASTKKKEGREFITSLAKDIDILNRSMQSPIERFGELGSSGNKAWTMFARLASGSFWWRLQARLRVFSNAAELFTDRQKAQNRALLESTDRLVEVKKGYDRTKDVVSQLNALGKEIEGLTKGTDEYNEVIAKLSDTDSAWGDMFQGLQHRLGSDSKAFNKLIGIYRNLNKDYEDEQEKTQKGYGKYLKHKLIKKMTGIEGEIFDDIGKGIAGRFGRGKLVEDESGITARVQKLHTGPLEQMDVLMRSGVVEMVDSVKDLGSTVVDAVAFPLRVLDKNRRAFMDEDYKEVGDEDYDEDKDKGMLAPRSRIFKQLDKVFKGGLLKNMAKFMALGVGVLMSAVMWGTAIALTLMAIVLIIRKGLPMIREWEKKFGVFSDLLAVFSDGALKVWEGISDLLHAIWEGDIIGIILAIWTKILPGILQMGASILSALLLGIGLLLYKLSIAVVSATYDAAVIISQHLKSIVGLAGGGKTTGGLNIVGEKGPELVRLPSGSRVFSNADSRKMGGNVINVNVSGHMGSSDADIRRLADKLGNEINRRVNRTNTSSTGF